MSKKGTGYSKAGYSLFSLVDVSLQIRKEGFY